MVLRLWETASGCNKHSFAQTFIFKPPPQPPSPALLLLLPPGPSASVSDGATWPSGEKMLIVYFPQKNKSPNKYLCEYVRPKVLREAYAQDLEFEKSSQAQRQKRHKKHCSILRHMREKKPASHKSKQNLN